MTPKEQAQAGLSQLKEAVVNYINLNPDGVTNADVTRDLKLESDFEGNQKNYLAWSILGLLVGERKIRYEMKGRSRVYFGSRSK